jgi:hypothetical protein
MASRDYEEFIAALNAHGVRYLLIGAHAVAFHARPRATKDLDILVEPTRANAKKVLDAMRDFFGGVRLNYTIEDVVDPDSILQLGVAPLRIDVLSTILGCPDFLTLWKRRVEARFGDVPTHYIGLHDLIGNKESTDRLQDRADVDVLRRAAAATATLARSRQPRTKPRS